jgi:hypothetical protein
MTMAATTISEISHVGGPLGFGAAARIGRRGRGSAGGASPTQGGAGSTAGSTAGPGARDPIG